MGMHIVIIYLFIYISFYEQFCTYHKLYHGWFGAKYYTIIYQSEPVFLMLINV